MSFQTGKKCMVQYHRLQHASREDALRQLITRETQLFNTSGFGESSLVIQMNNKIAPTDTCRNIYSGTSFIRTVWD